MVSIGSFDILVIMEIEKSADEHGCTVLAREAPSEARRCDRSNPNAMKYERCGQGNASRHRTHQTLQLADGRFI